MRAGAVGRSVVIGDGGCGNGRTRASARPGATLLTKQSILSAGMGAEAPLADIVMHGQDICRPLGIERDIPEGEARVVLDLLVSKKGKFAWPSRGVGGLRFEATDMEWSSGSGPVVSGDAEALLMALGGRAVAAEDLTGEGVAEFRKRF